MKRALSIVLCLLTAVLAAVVAAAAEPVSFVVIVNADNPADSANRSTVAALFLKHAEKWEGGLKSRPVDLAESSRIREVFSQRILRRHTQEVEKLWQAAIFSGRDIPPPKKATDAEIVAFVARYPGAIGYVSRTIPLPPTVKVLQIED
jgi:ABC-type phosphate transport system substrate-binding protein